MSLSLMLVLMNSDGEITNHPISSQGELAITRVVDDRFRPFRRAESQDELVNIALIFTLHSRPLLEVLVDGVWIESPSTDALPIPSELTGPRIPSESTSEEISKRYFVPLRIDDTIHFDEHNFKVSIRLAPVEDAALVVMPPPLSDTDDDVQVRSSNNQPTVDSETEDEDDLNRATSTSTGGEITPPTSKVTAIAEIKETPHQDNVTEEARPSGESADDAQLNADRSGHGAAPGAESPGTQAKGRREQRGRRGLQPPLAQTRDTSPGGFPSLDPLPTVKTTYSSRPGNATAETESKSDVLSDQKTSQILYPEERAHEAAARSVLNKRPAEDDLNDGPTALSSQKRLKKTQDPSVDDNDLTEDEDEDDDNDDDEPSQIAAGPRVTGKLPQVARVTDGSGEDDSAEETIIVAKKALKHIRSSPEVIVAQPQRKSKRTSKTPTGTPDSTPTSSLLGRPPKILTSSYKPTATVTKFLKAQGSTVITSVPSRQTNFLCVVKSQELPRTPKVLRSLALGKRVVTEAWIDSSKAAKELLDPDRFIHEELAGTERVDRRTLFQGKIMFFTNSAVKEYGQENWMEMKELAREAGASAVESGAGGKGGHMTGRHSIVYIGVDNDTDAAILMNQFGCVVYHKDLIKDCVVSGQLDLDGDTHRLKAEGKVKRNGRR